MFGHIPNNTSIKITAVFPISIMLAQNFKMGVGRPDLPQTSPHHSLATVLSLKLTMQDRGVTAALGRRGHLWDTWYAAIQKPFFPFLTSQIHTQTQTQMIKTAVSCVGERSQ